MIVLRACYIHARITVPWISRRMLDLYPRAVLCISEGAREYTEVFMIMVQKTGAIRIDSTTYVPLLLWTSMAGGVWAQ